MSSTWSAATWEAMYAPYDQPTYQAVLQLLRPQDVVLDIGAGDLRFSRQAALIAKKVYAVEIDSLLLQGDLAACGPRPHHLIPICADAQIFGFPTDLTVGVLLMRHCTHFRLYLEKLRRVGARRLITNARWHISVEEVDLWTESTSFHEIDMGWYACICGATGFKVGPAEQWLAEMDKIVYEVMDCPQCEEV